MKTRIMVIVAALCLLASPGLGMNAIAYFNLGNEASMTYKKIEYFSKALSLDPGMAQAYAKRGALFFFQGKYAKVIEDFENYVRLRPADAQGFRMLGRGYLKSGLYKSAIHSFNRAIELDPQIADPYAFRAEAFRLMGQHKRGVDDATRAVSLPGNMRVISAAYKTRSKCYRALERIEEADADMVTSVDLDPRYAILRYLTAYTDLEQIRGAGLFGIIAIALVLIFRLRLRPPSKDE